MKVKIIIILLSVITLFASCNKDLDEGVYSPKQRIEKIFLYSQNHSQTNILSEVWHWDNDKLAQIDYYSLYKNVILTSHFFKYDANNRLTQINAAEGNYYFTYQNEQLSKIEYKIGTILYATWEFKHKDKKITQMTLYTIEQAEKSDIEIQNICDPLNIIFPEITCKNMSIAMQKSKNTKSNIYFVCLFSYNKNDILKEVWLSIENNSIIKKWEYNYQYDKKKNPFYGLFCDKTLNSSIQNSVQYYGFAISEHNITHISDETNTLMSFYYEYKKSTPVTKKVSYPNESQYGNGDIGFYYIGTDGMTPIALDGYKFEYK